MRKGFDLFLQLWRKLAGRAHCVWVGAIDPVLQDGLRTEIDICVIHDTSGSGIAPS